MEIARWHGVATVKKKQKQNQKQNRKENKAHTTHQQQHFNTTVLILSNNTITRL